MKFSRCVIEFDLSLTCGITFMTLFLVVSEIRGGFLKFTLKKDSSKT